MRDENITADRLIAFSDGVFAVIVTIMVLELKAPDRAAAFSALCPLWPTATSYATSYLFIAIIWINHHHSMRFVGPPTLGLIWINFVHLFMVSLLPFATAWVACNQLASAPVVLYGRAVCMYRCCLQGVRTPCAGPCGHLAGVSSLSSHSEAPIASCPGSFQYCNGGCIRCTTRWLRSDLCRLGSPFTAGVLGLYQSISDGTK